MEIVASGLRPDSPASWLGFLADEARPPSERAVLAWVSGLMARTPDDERLFVAANLMALAVFRAGDVELASRISHAEIGYARRRSLDRPENLMPALRAQINLLRIAGHRDSRDSLAGLDQLGRLASGRAAELPDLSITQDRIDRAGLPVRRAARTAHIVETCKYFYRHGQWDQLAAAGAALIARYPESRDEGPHHAAEALWFGAPADQPPPAETLLDTMPGLAAHQTFLLLTHHAAHLADLGEKEEVARLATLLLGRRDILGARFSSPLTPRRWQASLADSLLRAGWVDLAEPVLAGVLRKATGDPVLRRGVADRLGLAAVAVAVAETRADRGDVIGLAEQVLERLGSLVG